MTPEAVRGKTLVMTTTNGTRGAARDPGGRARCIWPPPSTSRVAAARARDVARRAAATCWSLCAGRERHFALDDAYAAGPARWCGARRQPAPRKGLNDAALASLDLVRRYGDRVGAAAPGQQRRRATCSRSASTPTWSDAAREDAYPVLPLYHDRRITAAPSAARLL